MKRFFKSMRFDWKYILGEITLIFLGISLAIWFNNWNEALKLKRTEVNILTEIRTGLQADIKDLGTNLMAHQTGLRAAEYLQEFYLGGESENPDSLNLYLFLITMDATSLQNTAPYEYLKSRGISLVSDDSLRRQITDLYEYQYSELRTIEENFGPMQFYENFAQRVRFLIKDRLEYSPRTLIASRSGGGPAADVDIELLLLLRDIRVFRGIAVQKYRQRLAEVESLIEAIDRYLPD